MEKPLVHVFIDQENCLLSEPYVRTTLARLRADLKLHSFFGAAKAKTSAKQHFDGFDFVHKGLPLGPKKNALDFVMAIEAGRIMESERAKRIETRILFFSKDADFDSVAAHLRSCGATAHRTAAQAERVETLAKCLGVGCDELPDEFAKQKKGDNQVEREVYSPREALEVSLRYLNDIGCRALEGVALHLIEKIDRDLNRLVGILRDLRSSRPKTLSALLKYTHVHLLGFRRKYGAPIFSAVVCLAVFWMRAIGVVWFVGEKEIAGAINDTRGMKISNKNIVWQI